MNLAVSLFVGFLFAVGLGVAGMTLPERVLGFLQFTDPALIFTMGGAALTTLIGFALVLRRDRPIFGPHFMLPTRRDIDGPLLVGAGVFGLGWGLVGLCPGPALTGLASGNPQVLLFVAAMFAGMFVHYRVADRR